MSELTINFKKWLVQTILKWLSLIAVSAAIIPLAICVGGFWQVLAELILPLTFGLLIGIDLKNGYAGFKKSDSE